MNSDINNLLQPLYEEALYTESLKTRQRKYNPIGRSSISGHGLTLLGIITSINAKNILELGVAQGGTTLSLLYGAYLTGGTLTCVDKGVFPIDLNWVKNVPLDVKDSINLYKADSLQFLADYDEEIDFIFVDDWHNGEHVIKELNLIKDKISKSGVIALHDAMYGSNQPYYREDYSSTEGEFGNGGPYGGIKKFIDEDKENQWEFVTIPADHGLTILRKVL
jgi:predicted O-methyltransferase YrrM